MARFSAASRFAVGDVLDVNPSLPWSVGGLAVLPNSSPATIINRWAEAFQNRDPYWTRALLHFEEL